MSFLLALDQGTSSSRSIVFDRSGQIVSMAQREFRQIFPQPGWVEHDPREIWDSQLATAREALDKAGARAQAIEALGITNQRETTLVWNRRSGAPIHNAIVWQDRRSEPICAEMRERGLEPMIQERTGLRIDAYFSGTKLKWILDHVPDAREQARRGELAFGTVDSWLVWQLTGGAVHATDVSNASRTMLFNVRENRWDETLLQAARHSGGAAARGVSLQPCLRPRAARRAGPLAPRQLAIARHRRRPAGRVVRPGLLQGRAREEHLWHRLLHADAYRRAVPHLRQRPGDHQRGPAHVDAGVRARRQRIHCRRRGAVAARRAQRDQGIGRSAGPRR